MAVVICRVKRQAFSIGQMSWLVTSIQWTGWPARGSDNSTQSFTHRNSKSSKILSTKGLFVYYYYRVAEELMFVLSYRCANSLIRPPPPSPPKNVSLKMDPQSSSFCFGQLPPLRQFTWNPAVKSVPGLSSWSVLCGRKKMDSGRKLN